MNPENRENKANQKDREGSLAKAGDLGWKETAWMESFKKDEIQKRLRGPIARRMKLRAMLGQKASAYEDFEREHCPYGLLRLPRYEEIQRLDPSRQKPLKKSNGFFLGESLLALLVCMVAGFLIFASVCALASVSRLQIAEEMSFTDRTALNSEQAVQEQP